VDVAGNAQVNMDVAGVSQTSVVSKPEVLKPEFNRAEKTKEIKISEITKQDVEEMVEVLKELTQTLQTKLNFSIDDGTNEVVVKIIDRDTDKVIRQFPPEELLELQEKMQDLTGFLFSTDV